MQTKFRPDLLGADVFLAPGARLVGAVRVGDQSSVWFGAVVRGDTEQVRLGARVNVQDNAVLHADPGFPCIVGDDVSIGHGAIVHGARIGARSLIGMGAIVLNGAELEENVLLGAGALVPEGRRIPGNSLAIGSPARVVRELTEEDLQRIEHAAAHYAAAAREYRLQADA